MKGGIVEFAPVLSTTYVNTVVVVECRYALSGRCANFHLIDANAWWVGFTISWTSVMCGKYWGHGDRSYADRGWTCRLSKARDALWRGYLPDAKAVLLNANEKARNGSTDELVQRVEADMYITCRRHHCPKDALEYFPCPGRKMCTPCKEMRSAVYQPCDRKGKTLLQIELVGVNVPLYSKS